MSKTAQFWTIRIGLVIAGLIVATTIALSLSPVGSAHADTARASDSPRPPRIDVDPAVTAQEPAPAEAVARPAAMPADDALTLKRVLTVEGPFRHGDYVWDDEGVPPGEVIITVDLKAQTVAVFRGGYQIGAAVILYGADNYPTPLGTFRITQKKVHHISNLYNAPMPYMMRLTDDGVAIHASEVEWGNATHGCVGVPLAFAKLVFAQAKLGTRVIITSGKMMAVPENAQRAQASLIN